MDLYERVMQIMEGEDPPETWQTERGPVLVSRSSFINWTHRIQRTHVPTALECVALINSTIGYFNSAEERQIVDAWSKELLRAAKDGEIRPRDPVTLLPIKEIPEDLARWGLSISDVDKFLANLGMTWTITRIVEHMIKEADEALAREYEQLAGGYEIKPKQKSEPISPTIKLDWKQIARIYATEAWDERRAGSSPSKIALSKIIARRFEREGIHGAHGPVAAQTIERDALRTWRKPTTPPKN